MPKISLIACGESGALWDGIGDSIGVNDSAKWGHPIQRLCLLNDPEDFEQNRLKTIKSANYEVVYTCCLGWRHQLSNVITFRENMWTGQIKPGQFQTSKTSPFAAISIAFNLGYDEIVLYGVDYKSHPIWNSQNGNMAQEIKNYQQLAEQLKSRGVMVYHATRNIIGLPIYGN